MVGSLTPDQSHRHHQSPGRTFDLPSAWHSMSTSAPATTPVPSSVPEATSSTTTTIIPPVIDQPVNLVTPEEANGTDAEMVDAVNPMYIRHLLAYSSYSSYVNDIGPHHARANHIDRTRLNQDEFEAAVCDETTLTNYDKLCSLSWQMSRAVETPRRFDPNVAATPMVLTSFVIKALESSLGVFRGVLETVEVANIEADVSLPTQTVQQAIQSMLWKYGQHGRDVEAR